MDEAGKATSRGRGSHKPLELGAIPRPAPNLNAFCSFEPRWAVNGALDIPVSHPLHYGEHVVWLGAHHAPQGHGLVAKADGRVVWMIHPQDLRELTDEEL